MPPFSCKEFVKVEDLGYVQNPKKNLMLRKETELWHF